MQALIDFLVLYNHGPLSPDSSQAGQLGPLGQKG